jgi:predicted RNA-binding Zn ribbon-like protein
VNAPDSTPNFQFIAGNLAIDFVNTVGDRLGRSREFLLGGAELTRWAKLAGLISARERLHPTPRQLAHIRAVREELYGIFQPAAAGRAPSLVSLANLSGRCAAIGSARRLHREGASVVWRWNASRGDPRALLGPTLFEAAELLTSGGYRRLRECGDEHCGWLFLDRSAAGLRRWCRMADCGNRAKARRYLSQHPRSRAQ